MATTVTWDLLRDLAGFRAEKGCAISFYVNLDPSEVPTAGDAQTRFNSLLAEARRAEFPAKETLSREQKQGLEADFERIGRWLDDDFDRDGARGVAVFAAGLDNLWRAIPLPEPVPDDTRVANEFYLAPLVPLVGREDGAYVAAVNRERGQIFRFRAGRLEEVVDKTEDAPNAQQQGGWSQARYQRRVDNAALEHFREVAEELDKRVRRGLASRIVLICPEEMRSDVEGMVAQETQGAIVGWATAEAHAGAPELLEVAKPVLEHSMEQAESRNLERWREEAGRNARAASGWAATLEAASDARVELLLFQEGTDRPAFQCPACGRASVSDGSCPLDGTTMESREGGLDLALHQTLAHGGSVCLVRGDGALDGAEGIGAVLRF
jgi:peptide chain release factor subunit 1